MEMISAKAAYLDSMAGYNDQLEKIKESIFQVIQLANSEGKFQATFPIQDCPQQVVGWLNEYGYTVIDEQGYIVIDWSDALSDESTLETQTQEQEIDPADIDSTVYNEQVISGGTLIEEEEAASGLSEIYISQGDLGGPNGYRVEQIVIYGADINDSDPENPLYSSYFQLSLVDDDSRMIKTAKLKIAENCNTVLGAGGSLSTMVENSGKVLVFLDVPVENDEFELNNTDIFIDDVTNYEDVEVTDSMGKGEILNYSTERGYSLYAITVSDGNNKYVVTKTAIDFNNDSDQTVRQAFVLAQEAAKNYDTEQLSEKSIIDILKLGAAKEYQNFIGNTNFSLPQSQAEADVLTAKNVIIDAFNDDQAAAKIYTRDEVSALSLQEMARIAELKFSDDIFDNSKSQLIGEFLDEQAYATRTSAELNVMSVFDILTLSASLGYDLGSYNFENTPLISILRDAFSGAINTKYDSTWVNEATVEDISEVKSRYNLNSQLSSAADVKAALLEAVSNFSMTQLFTYAEAEEYADFADYKSNLITAFLNLQPTIYTQGELEEKTTYEILSAGEKYSYSSELRTSMTDNFINAEYDQQSNEENTFTNINKVYIYYELNSDGSPYIGNSPYLAASELAASVKMPPSNIDKTHIYEYINTVEHTE